ncbi:uncharacterized protein ASPGLDRAFT_43463 [Aspergillus glaucus CBS 516.65]|uniref:Uncharacterized protein n=1 Tax=Aspergillus glaucus CBS 516.65 TaxID=1160497 RepID=A0A1L9VSV3_ASPGL|nr:hypothetical protein ASPGLDRAFT_43463 [Aspergillus glaucus CBS 516.65]OJJ86989.1 hypothetical protein ASPGLDRAFT_43463 [Aspergillus glaucus CBS 516.65]
MNLVMISDDEGQLPHEHYLAQAESLHVSQLRQQQYSDVTQERLDETCMYWNSRYCWYIGVCHGLGNSRY